MQEVLDLTQPYKELDEGSDPVIDGADFVLQNGIIFAWSESNCRYERAWWLYGDATGHDLKQHLRKTRSPPAKFVPQVNIK